MKIIEGRVRVAASDVANFLACYQQSLDAFREYHHPDASQVRAKLMNLGDLVPGGEPHTDGIGVRDGGVLALQRRTGRNALTSLRYRGGDTG
jgi:hypothetical protein